MNTTFRHLHIFNSKKDLDLVFKKFLPQVYDLSHLRKLTKEADLQYEVSAVGHTYPWDISDEYSEAYYMVGNRRGKIYIQESSSFSKISATASFTDREPLIFPETCHLFLVFRPSWRRQKKTLYSIFGTYTTLQYYCEENEPFKGDIGEVLRELPTALYGGSVYDRHRNSFILGSDE